MYSVKWLLVLVSGCAFWLAGIACFRQTRNQNDSQTAGKWIANEYFINTLLREPELVGRKASDFPDLALVSDHGSTEEGLVSSVLTFRLLTSQTELQFPDRKTKAGDKIYLYRARSPKKNVEGVFTSSYAVYIRDDMILGVFCNEMDMLN